MVFRQFLVVYSGRFIRTVVYILGQDFVYSRDVVVPGLIEQNSRVLCRNLFPVPIVTSLIIPQHLGLIVLALASTSVVGLGFFWDLNGQ